MSSLTNHKGFKFGPSRYIVNPSVKPKSSQPLIKVFVVSASQDFALDKDRKGYSTEVLETIIYT